MAVGAKVTVRYGSTAVGNLNIAYREAGQPGSPKVVLLHGFPASSHQYRDLIRELGARFHVIAPDYPGFGNSDCPDPKQYAYTFDKLASVTEQFLNDHLDYITGHMMGFYDKHVSPTPGQWTLRP